MIRGSSAAAGAGYGLWFGFVLLLATWLTFPWGRVKDQVIVTADEAGVSVDMQSLGGAFVGVKTRGLRVGPKVAAGEDAAKPWIEAERLRVRTSLGGVIGGALAVQEIASGGGGSVSEIVQQALAGLGAVRLDGEIYGGELELSAAADGEEAARFDLNGTGLDLSKGTFAGATWESAPKGRANLSGDLLWHWTDPKKSSGDINLNIDGLVLEGTKISGFGVPRAEFGRAEAHLKINRGRAEFRDTIFDSDLVEARVEGFITLANSLLLSRLSLRTRFKVSEDFAPLVKSLIGSNAQHLDPEGWYHYQCSGTLKRPRCRPARSNRGRAGKNSKARSAAGTDDERAVKRGKNRKNRASEDRVEREDRAGPRDDGVQEKRDRLREERLQRREARRKRREEMLQRRKEAEDARGEASLPSDVDLGVEEVDGGEEEGLDEDGLEDGVEGGEGAGEEDGEEQILEEE